MKKRLQRIYWVGISVSFFMAFAAIGMMVLLRISDARENMRVMLEASSAWTLGSDDELQVKADKIAGVAAPVRVTYISESGIVLADSGVDAADMGSHINRPEFIDAVNKGSGESLRMSDTQATFVLYAARRISPDIILRLGYPVFEITQPLIFFCLGLAVLYMALYYLQRFSLSRFTKLLMRQMDEVRALLEGDLSESEAVFPELQPAINNIAYLARRLNSDLSEVNRTLGLRNDFVANASHELRSPLTSIMGFAEMLDEGLADTDEERALCVQTIRSECERMLDVIEDILMLSRAERQKALEKQNFAVSKVAGEICRALSSQAAQRQITLVQEGDMALTAVEKDVWEIIYNLVDNAIRYGKHGGYVKISMGGDAITVEDDGIGVDKAHLSHIFEEFYRVDQTRETAVRGTGLGLSIVRTLAERNGARVTVESELGKGSRFTVRFG